MHDTIAFAHPCAVQMHYNAIMATTHASGLILILLDCMERYRVGFAWTRRLYVCISAFLNSKVTWLCVECTVTRSQLHTHPCAVQIHYNGANTRLRIDFGGLNGTVSCWLWTNRKYVDIGAYSYFIPNICCLVSDWYTMARSQLHTHTCAVQKLYNADNTRLRIDFDFAGIYGTVLLWLWTSRRYVRISEFLFWRCYWLLGVEWTMTRSQLHTHVLFKYTTLAGDNTRLRIDFDCDFGWMHDETHGIVLALDDQAVRLYWCTFHSEYIWESYILWFCLVSDALWYDRDCTPTPIMRCSKPLQWWQHTAPGGTVSCWLWTSRLYVDIIAFLKHS